MECKEVRPLLDADLDRELPALEALRVQQHVDGCPACREARDALAALAGTVRRGGRYYRAPEALRARVIAMLPGQAHAQTRDPMAAAVAETAAQPELGVGRDGLRAPGAGEGDGVRGSGEAGYVGPGMGDGARSGTGQGSGAGAAAAVVAGVGNGARARPRGPLSWLADAFRPSAGTPGASGARAGQGWSSGGAAAAVSRGGLLAGLALVLMAAVASAVLLVRRPAGNGLFVNELVASHVRAELSGRDIDVVSTDQHTVKPWFNGRLDYAPPVEDLAASGFALTGGRLDYVGHRRVAVLIYRYRKHVIDVYVLPTSDAGKSGARAPLATQSDGYAVRRWQGAGMTWWAVSDAESSVLAGFESALAARLGGGA